MIYLLISSLHALTRSLQQYYRQTSREVRRLDSITLSPVYGAFGEVKEAAPCLRAFGLQRTFERRQCILVEAYQRAAISGRAIDQTNMFVEKVNPVECHEGQTCVETLPQ